MCVSSEEEEENRWEVPPTGWNHHPVVTRFFFKAGGIISPAEAPASCGSHSTIRVLNLLTEKNMKCQFRKVNLWPAPWCKQRRGAVRRRAAASGRTARRVWTPTGPDEKKANQRLKAGEETPPTAGCCYI